MVIEEPWSKCNVINTNMPLGPEHRINEMTTFNNRTFMLILKHVILSKVGLETYGLWDAIGAMGFSLPS